MIPQSPKHWRSTVSSPPEFVDVAVNLPPGLPRVLGTPTARPNMPMDRSVETPRSVKNKKVYTKKSSTTPGKSSQSKAIHRFALINPTPPNAMTVPVRGIKNDEGVIKYPLLLISQEGTMMLSLSATVVIEICTDKSFRVTSGDDFMAYVNSQGTVSSILHRFAKMVHTHEHVHCKFSSANEKLAVLGPEGVLFSMKHLNEAFLVSHNGKRLRNITKPVFPIQNIDYSLHQMYDESCMGADCFLASNQIVQKSTYERKSDGSLIMNINDMTIIHNGDTVEVTVDARPISVQFNSSTCTIHLRTNFVDMGVQERDKAFVKRGDKRVHASRSGMVVSDGTNVTSMDQFGRIVSST